MLRGQIKQKQKKSLCRRGSGQLLEEYYDDYDNLSFMQGNMRMIIYVSMDKGGRELVTQA